MRAELVSILALVATAVSIVLAVPQVWRTLVQGRAGGLSLGHVWFSVVMSVTWVHYGLHAGAVGAAANAALGGVLNVLVLVGLVRSQPLGAVARQSAAVLSAAGLWLASHAVLVADGDLSAVATLTAAASITAQMPQVLHMLRRPDLDLSGISATTWRLAALSNVCWLGYWALLRQPALVLPCVAGLLAAGVVLALLANDGAGRPHPAELLAVRRARRHDGVLVTAGAPAPVLAAPVLPEAPLDGAADGEQAASLTPTATHRDRRVLVPGRERPRRLPAGLSAGGRRSALGRPGPRSLARV